MHFQFPLTVAEAGSLMQKVATSSQSNWSQIATASKRDHLRSQFATLKPGRGQHRKYLPWVFTEHGALQVANILRSDRAIAMSVYVIRPFIELRDKIATNSAILKRLAEIDKTLLLHDSALRDVYKKLLPLLAPAAPPSVRKQIGFHS